MASALRGPRAVVLATVVSTLTLLLALVGAGRAAAPTGPYVSLGDSYTSAPLVPVPTGNPLGCGRSTKTIPPT
jgi:hypothetical protein